MATTKRRLTGIHLPLVPYVHNGVFAAMSRKLDVSRSAIRNVNLRFSTSSRIESELLSYGRNPFWWIRQNKRHFVVAEKAA